MIDRYRASLLKGDFELPFPACELRQCASEAPVVYVGPGFLSQRPDGSLALRVFAQPVDFMEAMEREFNQDLKAGVLVPETEYYDLHATDQYGKVWTAERLSPKFDFGQGTVIRAGIRRIETAEPFGKTSERATARLFLAAPLDLPWHGVTKHDVGSSRDRFEHEDDGYKWCFRKTDDGVDLTFNYPANNGDVVTRLLRAVSIVAGQAAEPLVTAVASDGVLVTRLHSRRRIDQGLKLLPPLKLDEPSTAAEAHSFIASFLANVTGSAPESGDYERLIYGRWHRVLRAGENDIENSSLVLSVAIEAVLKAAFASEHDVDEGFAQMLKAARPVVIKTGFEPRIQHRILTSFDHALTPTASQVLKRLVEQGVITQIHQEAWGALRNTSAHGDNVGEADFDWQKRLDQFHSCLALFYCLVFVLIEYRGPYRDLTVPDWPTIDFPHLPPPAAEMALA